MTEFSKIGFEPYRFDRLGGPGRNEKPEGATFKDVLSKFVGEVNDLQNAMETKIEKFAAGEITDVHEVMIAVEEADLAFNLMMEIRNKLVKAYEELMRMQV